MLRILIFHVEAQMEYCNFIHFLPSSFFLSAMSFTIEIEILKKFHIGYHFYYMIVLRLLKWNLMFNALSKCYFPIFMI